MTDPAAPRSVDPGSSAMAWLAALIAALCITAVLLLNQIGAPAPAPKESIPAAAAVDPADPVTISAKLVTKLRFSMSEVDAPTRAMLLQQLENPFVPLERVSFDEALRKIICTAEILRGEEGTERALRMLEDLAARPGLPPAETPLPLAEPERSPDAAARDEALREAQTREAAARRADLQTLRTIYTQGPESVSAEDRAALIARHAWFAEVALRFGQPDTDPDRRDLLGGGVLAIVGLTSVVGVMIVAVVAGLACSLIALILLLSGKLRPRFVAPAPGGSFGWELLAAFCVCFLAFKIGAEILRAATSSAGSIPPWVAGTVLAGQWLVALSIFWPLLRGVSFADYRRLVGWTAPRGVLRELGAGTFAYLAGLPLVGVALIISLTAHSLYQRLIGAPEGPVQNPILELAVGGSFWPLVLIFLLATVWAPLVEETVFRGGMYRALRTRLHALLAGAVSAAAFGVMHGYPFLLLGPVTAIGVVFALTREWRGSIVGPIFAHFLNNATILTLVFIIARLVR